MKKWVWILWPLTLCLAVVVTWFASLYIFERPHFSSNVQQHSLQSAALNGETREYLVHLPESYESQSSKRYPVIYVLDGSSQDIHTAASSSLMARIGVLPEVIVVGIPNISGTGRQRDYTPPGMRQDIDESGSPEGKADMFLRFLQEDLIPQIEREFRTTSTRELAGNSRGGLFVVYALTEKPSIFSTYYAHSPALWRDDNAIVSKLDQFFLGNPTLKNQLFLSLGSNENPKMKQAFQATVTVLEKHAPDGLRWRSLLTQGASHGNNAERATPVALQWAHEDLPERMTPTPSGSSP